MSSNPDYKRNYKREYATAKARGEQGTGHDSTNAIQHRARRKAIKLGMISKNSKETIDHKKPVSKGGGNAKSNLRVKSRSDNLSFSRNSDGSVKRNT